jgi:hypothetical protein
MIAGIFSIFCHSFPPLQWQVYTPEGNFPCIADGKAYADTIARMAGPDAKAQWHALEKAMAPLQRGAALFPAAAIRSDLGALLTAARFFGPQLLLTGLVAGTLTVSGRGWKASLTVVGGGVGVGFVNLAGGW